MDDLMYGRKAISDLGRAYLTIVFWGATVCHRMHEAQLVVSP